MLCWHVPVNCRSYGLFRLRGRLLYSVGGVCSLHRLWRRHLWHCVWSDGLSKLQGWYYSGEHSRLELHQLCRGHILGLRGIVWLCGLRGRKGRVFAGRIFLCLLRRGCIPVSDGRIGMQQLCCRLLCGDAGISGLRTLYRGNFSGQHRRHHLHQLPQWFLPKRRWGYSVREL